MGCWGRRDCWDRSDPKAYRPGSPSRSCRPSSPTGASAAAVPATGSAAWNWKYDGSAWIFSNVVSAGSACWRNDRSSRPQRRAEKQPPRPCSGYATVQARQPALLLGGKRPASACPKHAKARERAKIRGIRGSPSACTRKSGRKTMPRLNTHSGSISLRSGSCRKASRDIFLSRNRRGSPVTRTASSSSARLSIRRRRPLACPAMGLWGAGQA